MASPVIIYGIENHNSICSSRLYIDVMCHFACDGDLGFKIALFLSLSLSLSPPYPLFLSPPRVRR